MNVMTAANSLLPILRRLDEIERKLDRMLEELRTLNTPAAIGYSVRRGNLPRKDWKELAPAPNNRQCHGVFWPPRISGQPSPDGRSEPAVLPFQPRRTDSSGSSSTGEFRECRVYFCNLDIAHRDRTAWLGM